MLSKPHKCPKISRIIYLSEETAYLPLPYANINTYFLSRAKC